MGQFVVGDDLRENSSLPLGVGANWAKTCEKRLLILHGEGLAGSEALDNILEQFNIDARERYVESILQANIEALQKQVDEIEDVDQLEVVCDSRPGDGADVLLEQARSEETELLLLGYNPHRRLREVFLGTVTEELIHKSTSSVMIVKNDKVSAPRNILVAYDFSHHCDQALEWAKRIYKCFGAKVHLVNVVPCYYQGYRSVEASRGELNRKIEEMITENIHQFEEKLSKRSSQLKNEGVNVEGRTVLDKKGSVSDRLVEYIEAENIDLVLMGSHMRGKIKELFLGSVAAALIKKSPTSILVAK